MKNLITFIMFIAFPSFLACSENTHSMETRSKKQARIDADILEYGRFVETEFVANSKNITTTEGITHAVEQRYEDYNSYLQAIARNPDLLYNYPYE